MTTARPRDLDANRLPFGFQPDDRIPALRVVALVCHGSIFDEDVATGLEDAGHQVMRVGYRPAGATTVFDGADADPGALADRVMEFAPHLILSPNAAVAGMGELFPGLAEAERIPLVLWFCDVPPAQMTDVVPPASAFVLALSYDRAHASALRAQGYAHAEHLPLGTNPRRFADATPVPGDEPPVAVGYVGSLFRDLVAEQQRRLDLLTARWSATERAQLAALVARGLEAFAPLEGAPACAPLDWMLREGAGLFAPRSPLGSAAGARASGRAERLLPAPLAFFSPHGPLGSAAAGFAAAVVAHGASARRREALVRQLEPLGPHVWGEEAWQRVVPPARCHGSVPYDELRNVYEQCRVNLSVSHAQSADSPTQRVFDVPAMGGFVLTDWRPSLELLFDTRDEVVAFRTADEAAELAERYARDGRARRAIARRAQQRVLDFHTYAHRIEWITGAVFDRWPEAIHRPATRRTSVVLTSPAAVALPALGLVATSLIESGIERGRAQIVDALRKEPTAQGILTRLAAEEARAQGDRAQALALLRRALGEGEATRSQTQFALGQLALEVEGAAAALPHLLRAVALCPTEPIYHAAVGVAYLASSDWGRARAALEEALALAPELELARTWWDRFRERLETAEPVTDRLVIDPPAPSL